MALTLEEALLPTPKDSIGARVLRKMGWRPGQGIGPRLTWRQRKLQDLQASSGYSVAQDDIKFDENEEDEEANKHTFPRRDIPVLLVPRKENSHGLGYSPGLSLNDSLGGDKTALRSGPQISGRRKFVFKNLSTDASGSWVWSGSPE
jgi:G patch domain-containing protein 1